ncbi:peptide ABC transporter substrate-binding protein [Soehngenia longivitae]|uniref:Peptide ABC transporter substrate-binding protein n=1 Tax=Soehngenia longivitae TaxID=2562294 RepID=A0A4Z0D9D4_9FIRM|nr:peptide ABC transporter substrate-binding protein [Soehngenia longivitae]TFZ41465.1 peptide ABC transporter substrate-binding protein [Soehngenia longivitae]
MKSKKLLILLSLLLVVSVFVSACSSGEEPTTPEPEEPTTGEEQTGEKILRTNNSSEPGSLDPALAQGTHESWILNNLFEGLMKHDSTGQIVPGMAKEYTLSEDDLTYTFTLKDDIKWSNGDPVTAQDFEFAWKRALDPELAADYAYQLYYIKGAEAYNSGEGTVDDVAVKALDDKTLEVTLESPTAYFLDLCAFYTYYPVNKAVAEANPDWAKDPSTYVSNGPFTLESWEHNAKIKLAKNENYYDKDNIKLDGIDFDIIEDENTAWQKYEGGEYDILVTLPQAVVAQLKAENNPELQIGADVGTYYFNLNNEKKPFNNKKVRQALVYALDRQTIVDKIAQGGQIPATGIVPPGLLDENGEDYRATTGDFIGYDLEKAKTLLAEGLAEEGMTVEDFNAQGFVLLYNTSEAHKKIAQAAQEMWRTNLGIEIGLENVEFQVKLDREKAGDYDISRAGWIGDYSDPMTMLDLFYTDGPFNDAGYSNPEYDRLIDIAKSTADQKIRFDAMREAEAILMEDVPIVPVYFYTQPYAVKPYVTGVYKIPIQYPTITYADINK